MNIISTKQLKPSQEEEQTSYESKIYAWTLSESSTAACFVKDALSMAESGIQGLDYFWLGRVPCRTVLLIGLLVGVTVYETRILYTLDDGTGVIDCVHRPPEAQKRDKNTTNTSTPISLKPVAVVGTTIRIAGKVRQWHETRQIHISSIERCASLNEEPQHWLKVISLHKTHYDLSEPFIIPSSLTMSSTQDPPPVETTQVAFAVPVVDAPLTDPPPSTPQAQPVGLIDLTNISPSKFGSVPLSSFVDSTSAHQIGSPSSSFHAVNTPKTPIRLRHPSRIPTAKLTENTFRIYLKYYMDNVCRPMSEICDPQETPTKSQPAYNTTSKHKKFHKPIPDPDDDKAFMASLQGITMSYLRRVPELALLAQRVVIAESKRRIREERRKEKEKNGETSSLEHKPIKPENYAQKMKRLFRWAIVKLYEDGSVVQWDGPKRVALPDLDFEVAERSRLWQSQSDKSTAASSLSSISLNGEFDEGELSDPEPNEEAHVPLTTEYLAVVVRTAIGAMDRGSLRHLHSEVKRPLSQCRGYTPREVTKFLNRYDERWRHVGEWAVEETLQFMQSRGGVYDVGGGRWELCL